MSIFNQRDIRQISKLDLLAQQVVEGFIIGLHKSPFHGFSVEFAEHRLYNPGDNTRNIDWRVYGRTGKLFSKRYEEETNLRCQIVIDASSSMFYPRREGRAGSVLEGGMPNKFEFSALAAAALMNLLQKQRDAFGLSVFADTLLYNTRCKSSTAHYQLLISYLELLLQQASDTRPTNAVDSLHLIAESTHRRSLVMVFSDMLDRPDQLEPLFGALQHLRYNKHEVILFHVVHQAHEVEFAFENRPYLFIDLETGERIRLNAQQAQAEYTRRMQAFKQQLMLKCRQYSIDFVEADVEQGYRQVLMPYLVKRKRMAT